MKMITLRSSDTLEEKSFHETEEKWGEKDPETPKRNSKIGQYQQSPTTPLSETPDLKERTNQEHENIKAEKKNFLTGTPATNRGKNGEKSSCEKKT